MSQKRFEYVSKISSERVNENSLTWWYIIKTSWRRFLQDVLKTSWWGFEGVLARHLASLWHLENVLKMPWRRMTKRNILVLIKMSWRHLQNVFWRRMSKENLFNLIKTSWRRLLKTKIKDVFQTSSRRLHQDKCLLDYIFLYLTCLVLCAFSGWSYLELNLLLSSLCLSCFRCFNSNILLCILCLAAFMPCTPCAFGAHNVNDINTLYPLRVATYVKNEFQYLQTIS